MHCRGHLLVSVNKEIVGKNREIRTKSKWYGYLLFWCQISYHFCRNSSYTSLFNFLFKSTCTFSCLKKLINAFSYGNTHKFSPNFIERRGNTLWCLFDALPFDHLWSITLWGSYQKWKIGFILFFDQLKFHKICLHDHAFHVCIHT